jgi:sorbitol-6-phosphate 2-dehydrogenase
MANVFSIQERTALITGGAQGLGEHLAERLAQEGCGVAIADLQAEQGQALAERLAQEYGVPTLGLPMNVTDEAQVAAGFDAAIEKFGRLDICVANAGILKSGPIVEFDVNDWRQVLEVDLVGYMITAKHAVRVMLPRKSGSLIQINSKSGKKGSAKNSAYASSKFGGIGLTQSLALELAEEGIRVNAVCPGNLLDSPLWVNSLYAQYAKRWGISEAEVRQRYTDQVPMKRGCTYEDVANAVVFLASDASSYMTGQAINVTGGQEMH